MNEEEEGKEMLKG